MRPLRDLLNDDTIQPRKPLLGTWLLERGLVMLYAPTGVGKSWLSLGIAAAIAGAGSLGEHNAPEAHTVLYIDGEMDIADLKDRLKLLVPATDGADREALCDNILLFARSDQKTGFMFPNFGASEDRDQIIALVRQYRPALVVLDNLSTLASVPEENVGEAWDDLLELLQNIKGLGASVLVVHHANKSGESYRGSSKLAVLFDAIMSLKPDKSSLSAKGVAAIWTFDKMRMYSPSAAAGTAVRFVDGRWAFETAYDPRLLQIVDRIRGGEFKFQREIAEAYSLSTSEVSKLLRNADNLGLLSKTERDQCLQEARDVATSGSEQF